MTVVSSIVISNTPEPLPTRPLSPILDALSRALAVRDDATQQHATRVQVLAMALARQIGIADDDVLAAIEAAALVHDIGKLGIPDRLLNKPGPLTPEEYDQVKQHAAIGADILSAVPFAGELALFVRHHHENWDGTGYPDGLEHDRIPVGSRVLAIVDCYDALTTDRPYRRALGQDSAVAMIFERRGTMYDPEITDAFLRIVWRLRSAAANDRGRKQYAHVRSRPRVETRTV